MLAGPIEETLISILLDILTGFILAYHIVHHDEEENSTLTHTDKHATSMEKIALEKILSQIEIEKVQDSSIVHDCDIGADNIIQEIWPTVNILYDPNHFTRSQARKMSSMCSVNNNLENIKDRIVKFYSSLMHDRLITLEEKIIKWKGALEHYKETEGWTQENNSKTIETLKTLIDNFSNTFDQINPCYSTNPCESFNKARCLLADKDTGWRISWRLRAYISIIRWNDDNWIQTILHEFDIYDDCLTKSQLNRQKRAKTKEERKSENSRHQRSISRNKTKNKYKINKKEKNIHSQQDPELHMKKPNKLSKFRKFIITAMLALTTEDKEYVTAKKII